MYTLVSLIVSIKTRIVDEEFEKTGFVDSTNNVDYLRYS